VEADRSGVDSNHRPQNADDECRPMTAGFNAFFNNKVQQVSQSATAPAWIYCMTRSPLPSTHCCRLSRKLPLIIALTPDIFRLCVWKIVPVELLLLPDEITTIMLMHVVNLS
jgi:hypothetical protein